MSIFWATTREYERRRRTERVSTPAVPSSAAIDGDLQRQQMQLKSILHLKLGCHVATLLTGIQAGSYRWLLLRPFNTRAGKVLCCNSALRIGGSKWKHLYTMDDEQDHVDFNRLSERIRHRHYIRRPEKLLEMYFRISPGC